MSQKCRFVQLPQHFCQSFVPQNTLANLSTSIIQNPLRRAPADGYDVSIDKSQVLRWTPTTKGTVSLILYRAPTNGKLVELEYLATSIDNTGTYTWTPSHLTNYPSILFNASNNIHTRHIFTIAIIPDADPSKTNFWPTFAVGSLPLDKKALSISPSRSSSTITSSLLPPFPAPTDSTSLTVPQLIITDSTPLATSVDAAPQLDTTTTTHATVGPSVTAPAPASTATPKPSSSAKPRYISPGVIAAIVLGAVFIVLLSIIVAVFACRRKRRKATVVVPASAASRSHEKQKQKHVAKKQTQKQKQKPGAKKQTQKVTESRDAAGRYEDKWRRNREERWQREREKQKEKQRERQRVELERGWGPPGTGTETAAVGVGAGSYKSPRVSVPPKSRVVSEYL